MTLGTILEDYSPEFFQKLSLLESAIEDFKSIDGDRLVRDVFYNFFHEHKMENHFGLGILHRHFELAEHEKLVDYKGSSVPWNSESLFGVKDIYPLIWGVSPDGKVRPTEFRYAEGDSVPQTTTTEVAFMAKFAELLGRLGASHVFCLVRHPGNDFPGSYETPVERTIISFDPADCSHAFKPLFHDTTWFFSSVLWQAGIKCRCRSG